MAEKLTEARPYARAIFAVARDANALSAWSSALHAAAELIRDPQVARLLNHPAVADAALVDLLQAAVQKAEPQAGAVFADGAGKMVLAVLADNDRLGLLPEISALFDELKNQAEDAVDVQVVSAVELEGASRDTLVASLQRRLGHRIRLGTAVDASLVGGLVVRSDDLVIDGSVKHRLEKLAQALMR